MSADPIPSPTTSPVSGEVPRWVARQSGNRDGLWSVEAPNGELIFFGMEAARAHMFAAAPELLRELKNARDAIASLPDDALGMNSEGVGDTPNLMHSWPIRDELLHYIDRTIAKAEGRAEPT